MNFFMNKHLSKVIFSIVIFLIYFSFIFLLQYYFITVSSLSLEKILHQSVFNKKEY